MASNVTEAALAGWRAHYAPANPHLWSSPVWLAYEAGQALYLTGRTHPVKARMSRGYSVRIETAGDTDIMIKFSSDLKTTSVERL